MTPPVSDPTNPPQLKDPVVVDVSVTASKSNDDAQDDVSLVGLGGTGSSTSATDKNRLLQVADPPAPMKTSGGVDVSMSRMDDDQGDVLGLNAFMAKKRLLSTHAASLAADADAEEEAKAAARKKTRLGWGQGLAKYENRYNKKDYENTHKFLAHDGATREAASSHGSCTPPPGEAIQTKTYHSMTILTSLCYACVSQEIMFTCLTNLFGFPPWVPCTCRTTQRSPWQK